MNYFAAQWLTIRSVYSHTHASGNQLQFADLGCRLWTGLKADLHVLILKLRLKRQLLLEASHS